MLDRFRGRLFAGKAIDLIEAGLTSAHDEERGKECVGMFATAITKAQEHGEIPSDLMEQFRKRGLTVEEAALSYLDASISFIKLMLAHAGSKPDFDAIIADMETGLDRMFLAKPGRVVPRNGQAGPMMAEFTTEWSAP